MCDNVAAIKIAENNVFHRRAKHIDVQHHFVKELTGNGVVSVEYVPTSKMVADPLTKVVGRSALQLLTNRLHGRMKT